ncbi:MAG: PEP-CTERM sorting domain-containing protein [Rhodoferax sp.]
MSFDDISNPDAGGTINVVFDSTKVAGGLGNNKPNMFDNMTVTKDGKIILQEDVGNAEHVGKVWEYDINTKSMRVLGEFDRTLFGDLKADGSFVAGLYTKDEESSGVFDVTDILGKNDGAKYYLLTSQIHASAASLGLTNPTALVEGGQLNMMRVAAVPEPETYAMFLAGLGMLGTIARRRKAK